MRTQNKGTRSSHSRITTIAIAVASSFAMTPAWAAHATNLPGNGVGIAIGSGSNAPKAENVAIGKSAIIKYSNGDTDAVNLSWLKKSVTKVESASQGYIDITTRKENASTNNRATIYSVGLSPYAKSGIDYSNTYLGLNGIDAKGKKITGVAAGDADTDAVNLAQLKAVKGDASQAVTESKKHSSVVAGNNIKVTSQTNGAGGTEYSVSTTDNVSFSSVTVGAASISQAGIQAGSQKITNVYAGSNDTDAVNVRQLKDSRSKVESGDPSYVTVGERKEDSANNSGATIYSVALTTAANDAIKNANDYLTATGINARGSRITGVAAGDADTDAVNVAQLKKAAAAATTTVATTDSNLTVAETETPSGSHNYQVGLNKSLTGMESAEFVADAAKTTISAGGVTIVKDSTTVSLKSNGLDNGGQTIKNVAAGENDTDAVNLSQLNNSVTKVESASQDYIDITTRKENASTNTGATIYSVGLSHSAQSGIDYSNTYLGPNGIDAKGKKITGVAAGSVSANSTDAVNGSQLYQTNQAVQQNSDDISKLYNRSAELNRKIHRAGAHAAALAALHPLDFDENHRVSASLGLGQYHSSGAAALGIFVRPTENFMVSLGGSIASGSDVMGNLGVHYRFGGDSVRMNKTELTQQVSTLTAENRDLSAKLASSNSKLEAATSKIDSLMERIHAIEAKLNMK